MTGFSVHSPTAQRYLRFLRERGEGGATDAEAEEHLGVSRTAVCAARKVLIEAGMVKWSGKCLDSKAGQPPRVWVIKEKE